MCVCVGIGGRGKEGGIEKFKYMVTEEVLTLDGGTQCDV